MFSLANWNSVSDVVLFLGLSRDVEGDTTPEYQPPDLPEMDIKPDMMKCVKTDPGPGQPVTGGGEAGTAVYRGYADTRAVQGDTGAYLGGGAPVSSAHSVSAQWSHASHYSASLQQQQMSLGVAASAVPYTTGGYCAPGGRDITGSLGEEFREAEEESCGDMKAGREEIGHYDNDMISQTGPIRGYPSRADGFVWRPY